MMAGCRVRVRHRRPGWSPGGCQPHPAETHWEPPANHRHEYDMWGHIGGGGGWGVGHALYMK